MSRIPAVCLLLAITAAAAAHEVQPALLRIHAVPGGAPAQGAGDSVPAATLHRKQRYDVLWKEPLAGSRRLPLAPVFPKGCEVVSAPVDAVSGEALVRRFRIDCASGLRGGAVAVDGLDATITDVMLHITLHDGTRLSSLLRPASPSFVVEASDAVLVSDFLLLGIEHLLFGFDHIAFVIALMFFLPAGAGRSRTVRLVKIVTAFTVAHSFTLGLSVLDLVKLPQAPVEAVIALSILFLAVEKLRGEEGSITATHTWIVAFAFGLLHGFGFAGALADVGLPRESAAAALFLFNVGVEIGQLGVVAAGLGILRAVDMTRLDLPERIACAPLYAIGGLAAYWFVDRTAAIVV